MGKQMQRFAESDMEEAALALEEALPPLVAPTRAAQALDIDRRRIYEMIKHGELPVLRVGKRGVRICRQSLVDWVRRGGSMSGRVQRSTKGLNRL